MERACDATRTAAREARDSEADRLRVHLRWKQAVDEGASYEDTYQVTGASVRLLREDEAQLTADIEFDLPDSLPPVFVDQIQIQQVLLT
jgi:hypothetical protein